MFFFSLFPHTLTPRSFFFLCFPTLSLLVLLAAVRSYNNAQYAEAVAVAFPVAGVRGVTGGGVPDDTRDEGLRAAAFQVARETRGYERRPRLRVRIVFRHGMCTTEWQTARRNDKEMVPGPARILFGTRRKELILPTFLRNISTGDARYLSRG